MRCQQFPLFLVSLAMFSLPFLAAQAEDLITRVPTLHVPSSGVQSQAQLADRVRAEGYSDVILSSTYPSPADPLPWRNPTLTSNPGQTPVHDGWNGVAFKNGQIFQVYADH